MHDCKIEFTSLPDRQRHVDPTRQKELDAEHHAWYRGIYADLKRLGHPVPPVPPDEVTRDQLHAHLQLIAGALLEEYAAKAHAALGALPHAPNAIDPLHLARAAGVRVVDDPHQAK